MRVKKKKSKELFCTNLVTPSKAQGHWKWHRIAEVSGANKHGKYERIRSNSLCLMSNVEVFEKQDRRSNNRQPNWRTQPITYGSKKRCSEKTAIAMVSSNRDKLNNYPAQQTGPDHHIHFHRSQPQCQNDDNSYLSPYNFLTSLVYHLCLWSDHWSLVLLTKF